MKYQLVIQFLEEQFEDIYDIANMEDRLSPFLVDAEVDGHDIGSGEINIFIHTNNPVNNFEIVKNILEEEGVNLEYVKIAYRDLDAEKYIVLWPKDLVEFNVI